MTSSPLSSIKRRTLLAGAAWSAPVLYSSAAVPAYAASAQQPTTPPLEGHANVVVVVRFAGDTRGDNNTGFNQTMPDDNTTYWQSLKQEFAPTGINYITYNSMPLSTYMDTISNGQWQVQTSYPQDPTQNGKTIQYITLPYTLDHYPNPSNDFDLVRDTMLGLKALNPDTTNWDLDKDGMIDNLSIVVQLPAGKNGYNSGSFLVPHHATNPTGVQINGLDLAHYLVLPSTSNTNGRFTIGSSNDTIKHEYLHTVGIWDLYRGGAVGSTTGDTPVGIWSIMAQANRTWPLAQEREDLGWLTIPDLDLADNETKTITLHTQYNPAGPQAIRLESPYTDAESFVVEFRKQAPRFQGLIDDRIPATGAIIYRVNNAVNNTHDGKSNIPLDGKIHDYIYVYRQDSEGSTSRGPVPSTAALNSTTISSFGQADLNNRSNAILDAEGRNTGLTVKVLSTGTDSITLEISRSDTSAISIWQPVGTPAPVAVNAAGSFASSGTTLARSATTGSNGNFSTAVQTLNQDAWGAAGTPFSGDFGEPQLAYLGQTLYAAAPNYRTNAVEVKRYANGSWSTIGTAPTMGNSPIYFGEAGGTLYLVGANNNGSRAQVYTSNGTNLTQHSASISGQYVSNFAVADVQGKLFLAASDVFANNHKLYALENNQWVARHTDASAAKTMALIPANGSIYELLLGADNTLSLRQFTADGKLLTTSSLGRATLASMAVSGDKAVIAVEANQQITVYTAPLADITQSTQLGEKVTLSGSGPEVEILGDTVYVSYKDTAQQTMRVSSHKLA
ncbi:MAG: hypothetical protein Q4A03_02240 [Rothia sp. (in: high G+C Gram-positive bacteria)]|uniref:hypothetical protein n=1 Tax=Rothia sp. (in: high G+C Gram-positive bacteria) TaxID=1885016 RepID=UPI0026F81A65|nr:hypothetical protein [Rothia sp. (in: high G+C Gram-positive bacteria)]